MRHKSRPVIRALLETDAGAWQLLWDAYNAFYGRTGTTALPDETTRSTWTDLTRPAGPVRGLVAELDGRVVGLAHYLFHASTTAPAGICYLQDLIVAEGARRRGIGAALIESVKSVARDQGVHRVYWQTHETNGRAITLYERIASRTGFIVFTARL